MFAYLYVCRHGFRSDMSVAPTRMIRDFPLAGHGLNQAAHLATFLTSPESLAPHPVPDRIFSSPFYRCVQTAAPTAAALALYHGRPAPIALEHGVQEWYCPAREGTGLHPRPGGADSIAPFFPPEVVDTEYTSTVYADRKGEDMREVHERLELFVDAWTGRMDGEGVRTAVVFAHAATVIALGRALTGNRDLHVTAGCAATSLYRRVRDGGVGAWEVVYDGRVDYLPHGLERDWSFMQVEVREWEVIDDVGDYLEHPPEDELPVGLAPGMEQFLPANRRKPGGQPDGAWERAKGRVPRTRL